uniref:Uncharacterized protein n=1 Tax=Lactuca sativa TaxID=4236 RepID=A0A9R1UKB8_LACSA|nr:hypothetical protein LSAT_V11C900493520 [Lactuca sativa]
MEDGTQQFFYVSTINLRQCTLDLNFLQSSLVLTEDCAYAACFICAVNGINRVDEAEELPLDEWRRQFFCLNSLGEIAKQMGKHDFDFSLNPCDGNPNWTSEMHLYKYNNTLVYVCSYPGGVCHVVAISLKGQDLESVLPSSLAKLHYISDLNGNTSQFLNLG